MTTYRFNRTRPGVGLFQPLELSGRNIEFMEVTTYDTYQYPFYIEDKEYRENYDTIFINRIWRTQGAIDVEYLTPRFVEYEFRPMFFGENMLFNLYRIIQGEVAHDDRQLLDKEKIFSEDFSQITQHFDKVVGGVVVNGKIVGFIHHDYYIKLLNKERIPTKVRNFLVDKGLDPYRDILC